MTRPLVFATRNRGKLVELRQLLLGSEGAFGVITSVTVRVRRAPELKRYDGWRWPAFAKATAGDQPPPILRLASRSLGEIKRPPCPPDRAKQCGALLTF